MLTRSPLLCTFARHAQRRISSSRPTLFALHSPHPARQLSTAHLARQAHTASSNVDQTLHTAATMRATPHLPPFPLEGLLPKESTQAAQFLARFPEYDGRGVRVAILDTGVDPAAKGLNGKGKVVDVIDCTGSGDIPLAPVKPESSTSSAGQIALKSPTTKRTLLLSSSWKNPSGVWSVGTKAAYDLWPRDLIARRKAERKKEWDVGSAAVLASVQEQIYAAEKAAPAEAKDGDAAAGDKDAAAQARAQHKAELKARLDALKELSYEDPGPIIEVVSWFDGSHWRAVVGGAEGESWDASKGLPTWRIESLEQQTLDLSSLKPMADFAVEKHHERFGVQDLLTYSVNHLYGTTEKGKAAAVPAISLVVTSGSHATHVAGIVGANRPDAPEQNGVAPGCEIVSLMIGDGRLGSMETQQALIRAAQAILTTGCDIANMSFGETGAWGVEDKGAFAEQLRDIVIRQRDVLFISSAGNSGPALSTVGQPGGTTTGILSIGAYVDAGKMQQAEYALVEEGIKSSVTTWCSRGPTFDGARGVDVYAPGAAITSIPLYCLQATMLANGTSMSSPNACGAIALLLSGLKAKGIPVTPARVFKAIRATAKSVNDDLGVPFIQIDRAWDYLVEHAKDASADAEWRVAVTPAGKPPGRSGTDQRGVYLRDPIRTNTVQQFTITSKPTFKNGETEKTYALQIAGTLTSTAPWVTVPQFVFLGGNGRSFEARVDTTGLAPGLHTASVEAWDSETGTKLFDVPITIAKPLPATPTVRFERLRLDHGKVDRRFVAVPEGATWAEIRFRSSAHQSPGTSVKLWSHSVQALPHARLGDVEKAYVLVLNEGEPVVKRVPVTGGATMEMCLAQFWASASGFVLDVEVEFHGITFAAVARGREETTLIGGEGIARVECASSVRVEELSPKITFEHRRAYSRPTSSELRPLTSPRDLLPSGGAISELVLTYPIEIKEDKATIKYGLPLSQHLYDASIPMLAQLFDVNKKRVNFGDVYSASTAVDLPKGAYTLKVELLGAPAELDKLRNMTLRVDTKLAKPASLDVYEDHVDLFGKGKPVTFKGLKLHRGERKILCLDTNLEGEAVPKGAEPGDVLIGTMTASGAEAKGELRLIVPPAAKKAATDDGVALDDKPTLPELLTGLVAKVPEAEKEAYLAQLLKDYPEDLGVLVARLKETKPDDKEKVAETLAAADAVLKVVDEQAILLHAGAKKLPATEQTLEQKREAKKLDAARDAYVLALNRRARALLARDGASTKEFADMFDKYRKVADDKDKEFSLVATRWNIARERFGSALVAVRKTLKDLGAGSTANAAELRTAKDLERELLDKLGWTPYVAIVDRIRVLETPASYTGF